MSEPMHDRANCSKGHHRGRWTGETRIRDEGREDKWECVGCGAATWRSPFALWSAVRVGNAMLDPEKDGDK